jgi:hypothetical protein
MNLEVLMNNLLEFIEKHPLGVTREQITAAFMAVDAAQMDKLIAALEVSKIIEQHWHLVRRKIKL